MTLMYAGPAHAGIFLVFSIYNKIYKSPFITDIRWSASGTEIRTPIERRTVRGTADTCS